MRGGPARRESWDRVACDREDRRGSGADVGGDGLSAELCSVESPCSSGLSCARAKCSSYAVS